MRSTRLLAPTLKEDPSDADVASHRLLLRAGMIRQVARGIYDFLPLGLRAVQKVERIVREEMDRAGAQEILMPAVCPAELWQESGRWSEYGPELLRFQDRHGRDFCFGPTHEEVVTDLVRREVRSYRDLPINLYQIQGKFRDEIRPRFGLMRGREFLMKDAYSFHVDEEDCRREYENMFRAYTRIFERCGLRFRPVEADTGAIGGSLSHEFQVLAESGEDAIASCPGCEYAANVEMAEGLPPVEPGGPAGVAPKSSLGEVETPDMRTIEEVSAFLGLPPERFVKTLVYTTDRSEPVVALVRGDREISAVKLRRAVGANSVTLADEATVERVTGAPLGFAGPHGLAVRIVADEMLRGTEEAVSGANRVDRHVTGLSLERDVPKAEYADLRVLQEGDRCRRCGDAAFEFHRGIEVGHVFYLGRKYSDAMGATVLDGSGTERVVEMGCYGIGITRTVAAAIEQNHDERGIVWPMPLAPYQVILVPVNQRDAAVVETAERLYEELQSAGVEVLLDDRDERPGVKFNDADLIGIPLRITVGPKGLARQCVEIKERTASEAEEVGTGSATNHVADLVRRSLGS